MLSYSSRSPCAFARAILFRFVLIEAGPVQLRPTQPPDLLATRRSKNKQAYRRPERPADFLVRFPFCRIPDQAELGVREHAVTLNCRTLLKRGAPSMA
jgi:hypothetical protein